MDLWTRDIGSGFQFRIYKYLESEGEDPPDEGVGEAGAQVGHHPVEVRRVLHAEAGTFELESKSRNESMSQSGCCLAKQ